MRQYDDIDPTNAQLYGGHDPMTLTWQDANLDRDERALALAHKEYRELSLDERQLSALETSTFRAILKRAQEIKETL